MPFHDRDRGRGNQGNDRSHQRDRFGDFDWKSMFNPKDDWTFGPDGDTGWTAPGENPLIGLTDLFSKLETPEEYRGMIEDPLGHFGLGKEYAQFFPSFDFYQRQFSDLFGEGEGSIYETEMERTGQVGRKYEFGRKGAVKKGTESLLDLTEQLRGTGARAGGFGAQKALGRDIREEAAGTYAEKLSGLSEEKELGMYGVEKEVEGMYGQAQSLMGDFINQYLSIYRNIMANMPTDDGYGGGRRDGGFQPIYTPPYENGSKTRLD